jgi:hypothetical protein
LKDDAEIVPAGTSPRFGEFALEFVRSQGGMMRILRQSLNALSKSFAASGRPFTKRFADRMNAALGRSDRFTL